MSAVSTGVRVVALPVDWAGGGGSPRRCCCCWRGSRPSVRAPPSIRPLRSWSPSHSVPPPPLCPSVCAPLTSNSGVFRSRLRASSCGGTEGVARAERAGMSSQTRRPSCFRRCACKRASRIDHEEQERGLKWMHQAHKCRENHLDYLLPSLPPVLASWCKSYGRAAVQNLGRTCAHASHSKQFMIQAQTQQECTRLQLCVAVATIAIGWS